MRETQKVKKTYYIEGDLVKSVKIKAAIDETTETEIINLILREYFKSHEIQSIM